MLCVYVYIYIYIVYIYIYIHILNICTQIYTCIYTRTCAKTRLTQFDGKGEHLMRTPMHTSCIQDAYPGHAEEVANKVTLALTTT